MDLQNLKTLHFKIISTSESQYPMIDGKFLRGPIPWAWLASAGQLPGQALHVAIVLWLLRGLNRSMTVKIEKAHLREMGVSHTSYYRGLTALEQAMLVSVVRAKGRNAEVTIKLDVT